MKEKLRKLRKIPEMTCKKKQKNMRKRVEGGNAGWGSVGGIAKVVETNTKI